MKKRIILFIYIIALLALAIIYGKKGYEPLFSIVGSPFSAIGNLLRYLSLKSSALNCLSIILYIIISLIPIYFLLVLLLKKKAKNIDLFFLALLSASLFLTIYYYINPFLLKDIFVNFKEITDETIDFILLSGISSSFYLILFLYIGIKLITSKTLLNNKSFLRFIDFITWLLLFGAFYLVPSKLFQEIKSEYSSLENLKIVLSSLNSFITIGLYIYSLHIFKNICIRSSGFEIELINETKKLNHLSKVIIIYLISSLLFFNIYQIVFGKHIQNLSFALSFPLTEILIFFLTIFLTNSFIKSNKLQEENRLTI